jgi:hypothetical protein
VLNNLTYNSLFTLVQDLLLQKKVVFTSSDSSKLSKAIWITKQVLLKSFGFYWPYIFANFVTFETDYYGERISAESWSAKLMKSP